MDLNQFWITVSQGINNVPTLGYRFNQNRPAHYISATIQDGRLIITAGNGTVQAPISQNKVFEYINQYIDNPNDVIEGNKRYVIALYLHVLDIV